MMNKKKQQIYARILTEIKMGFIPMEEVTASNLRSVKYEGWSAAVSARWIRQTVKTEYEKHLEASLHWQRPTDTERIGEVFDSLCQEKIIALHNAGYTSSEAIDQVRAVHSDLTENGIQPIGYCYYYEQDLQSLVGPEGGNLRIGFYGVKDNDEENAL